MNKTRRGPQKRAGSFKEEKNVLPWSGIETRFLGCSALSLVNNSEVTGL